MLNSGHGPARLFLWESMALADATAHGAITVVGGGDSVAAINKFKLHLDERFPPILGVKRRERNYSELVLTLMIREPHKKDEITTEINRKITELTEEMKRKDRKKP